MAGQGCIDRVLELLPKAQKQAHERIISGRLVANRGKILSLYEPDVRVVVRGRAEAELEFGTMVLLGENGQGIILDYQVWRESTPADVNMLVESLERVSGALGQSVAAVATDRGFASAANSWGLKTCKIFDGTCPRQPAQLKARMSSRRSQYCQEPINRAVGRGSRVQAYRRRLSNRDRGFGWSHGSRVSRGTSFHSIPTGRHDRNSARKRRGHSQSVCRSLDPDGAGLRPRFHSSSIPCRDCTRRWGRHAFRDLLRVECGCINS